MGYSADQVLPSLIDTYSLASLDRRAPLESLAEEWGVTSISEGSVKSDAMLLSNPNGYKIILKKGVHPYRQRFSLAHELGHLLLRKMGYSNQLHIGSAHRSSPRETGEEYLCDKIAAEILMPRRVFQDDCGRLGWSLCNVLDLSKKYQTSVPAIAIRMVDLMPEYCLLAVWNSPKNLKDSPKLDWAHSRDSRFGVPGQVPRSRMWLAFRAMNGQGIQKGLAPILDKSHPRRIPSNSEAEAFTWGSDNYRRVMIFYYPERPIPERLATF